VVSALKLELLPGKLPDSTQRTHSPAAYEQYLIAQGVFRAGVKGAPVETALSALQRAIAIDPDYANAYALQSMALGRAADFAEDAAARERLISAALASADKAIALAPDLAIGYVRRGSIRFAVRWDWMGAKTDFERALALEPDNAIVLSGYAHMLLTLGSREQALQLFRKAVVSDPLAVNAWTSLGRGLEAVGQTAEAKRSYERALELSPKMPWEPTFSVACCCGPGTPTRPSRCSRAWMQKPDPMAVSPWPNTHAATKWRRAMRWLRWRRMPRLVWPTRWRKCVHGVGRRTRHSRGSIKPMRLTTAVSCDCRGTRRWIPSATIPGSPR